MVNENRSLVTALVVMWVYYLSVRCLLPVSPVMVTLHVFLSSNTKGGWIYLLKQKVKSLSFPFKCSV